MAQTTGAQYLMAGAIGRAGKTCLFSPVYLFLKRVNQLSELACIPTQRYSFNLLWTGLLPVYIADRT